MIEQSCIEQVKAAANVVEVVGRYIKLKKDGVNLVACCPFHNEKSPSFKVSQTKNIYKCFGCGATGDSIEFVMKHEKKNYIEAITILAAFYNITLTEEPKQTDRKLYTKPVFKNGAIGTKYLNWFANRGISAQTLTDLKVTQAIEWMPKAQKETETICFNYFRDNDLTNVKYRAENKDFKLSKDAELIFYNIDSIKGLDYCVITEGEMDCLSIHQSGIKAVISVPNGAAKGNQRLDYLNNCWDLFENVKTIILFVDNDDAGMSLRDELGRRFGYDRCWKVNYPDGCKDANDILLKHGAIGVLNCIKNPVEFPIEGIHSMDVMYHDVRSYYENGYPNGVKVGIPGFDDFIQFMPGQFTTWTGVPGAGKSEFIDYTMAQLAKNHAWPWGVCSFENQPSSLHVTKIMEKYVGKSFAKRYDDNSRISVAEFENAVNFIDSRFYFINIDKVDVTLDGILAKAKELVIRKGIKGLLIDPWNYIEHKGGKTQTETQYISECLTKIKAFCAIHQVHIFLVAHPLKMPKVNGKYEVPTLYNISGSAHFNNKTDNGITVHRDFETNQVDIYIQKVRYSWLGKVGFCSFTYDTEKRQYVPMGEFSEPQPNPMAGIKGRTIKDITEPKKTDEDAPF